MAQSYGLEHESIGNVGTVYTYNHQKERRPCVSTCNCSFCVIGMQHEAEGKAVLIAVPGRLDDAARRSSRVQAAAKAPSDGGSLMKRGPS